MKNVKKKIIAFDGNDCIEKMMCYLLGLRGEPRKVGSKLDEYNLQVIPYSAPGFDSCGILNILSNW